MIDNKSFDRYIKILKINGIRLDSSLIFDIFRDYTNEYTLVSGFVVFKNDIDGNLNIDISELDIWSSTSTVDSKLLNDCIIENEYDVKVEGGYFFDILLKYHPTDYFEDMLICRDYYSLAEYEFTYKCSLGEYDEVKFIDNNIEFL